MGIRKYFILIALLLLFSQHITCCGATDNYLSDIREYVFTNYANEQGLLGNGIIIGVWESSSGGSSEINSSRSELAGRVTVLDDYVDISSHATNVALILGSKSSNIIYNGMAPNVEMYSYDYNDVLNELSTSGVDISTNSYGMTTHLSEYTTPSVTSRCSQYYDAAIREKNIIAFKSAGNMNSNSNTYSIITSPGTAKNIITVGAVKEDDFSDTAYFSSFGPCNDGRLKPEIVAPGYKLRVDSTTSDNISGTSYACPVVSGSAALILEEWKNTHSNEEMLPSTMKALLVHTANNDGNGPTYRYGYGMLDTKEAIDLVQLDTVEENTTIQDYTTFAKALETNQTIHKIDVPANTGELKVTLAWSDIEGSDNPNQNDLINDLNLVVYKSDDLSTYYYPWVLDPDNVMNPATKAEDNLNPLEQVQIEDPISGEYSIKVDGTLIEGPQNFSLIITTKPKVTVYSDKEGAEIYVNNLDGNGVADGVIENGVGEISVYAGNNEIVVDPPSGNDLKSTCDITEGEAQAYYCYFESYTLDLQTGTQVISLPFDAAASDIMSPSGATIFRIDSALTLNAISSSGDIEKGKCYLIISPNDCSISLGGQFIDFTKVRFDTNYGFVGAPPSTMKLFDFLGLDDYAEKILVYRYNLESDDYELVESDENVNPGDALFVFCAEMLGEVFV